MPTRSFSLAALTVLELSPPDMVEVAARAGYQQVELRLVPATPDEQHFPLVADAALRRQTLARLHDTGIQVLDIEILRLKPESRVESDFARALEIGAELGASQVLVAGNDDDEARLTDNFTGLCDLAAGFGLNPHLEFMPWTGVKNLEQARRIVTAVARPNAGLLVDAFHFDRSGSHLDDLATIPAGWMHYVQLCDVIGSRPDDMAEIIRQARQERCFPGDGDIDLEGLLHVLPSDVPLSLEIPTQALRERGVSALDRARMALEKTQRLLGSLSG